MLRLGLVGIGDAGGHHAGALAALHREGVLAWTAVVARDPAKAAAFVQARGVPGLALHPGLDALVAAGTCDAVVLATPDGLHAEQVVEAAGAGLAVLCEKPLALTRAEGERAMAAAKTAGVHLAVGYQLRHHPAHLRLAAELATRVGPVRSLYLRWAWPDPATQGWRARGEGARFWAMAALGTHLVDLALTLGGPLRAVAGLTWPETGADTDAAVALRLGDGCMAQLAVSVGFRAVSRVVVSGPAGELEALGTLGARGDGELCARAPRQPPEPLAFTPGNPYLAQLRAFVAAVPAGYVPDPRLLDDLTVLDRLGKPPVPA